MPIVYTVSPDKANGKVAAVYREIEQSFGRVPNALQMYSASPEVLEQQWRYIQYYRQHPRLSAPLLAMVRMLVSQENQCEYCVGFNAAMLISYLGLTPEQVAATKRDPGKAPLEEKDKAMLLLVLKSIKAPLTVTRQEIEHLVKLGWTEGDIVDAVSHGARNMAVDVIFNTFKIENDF
ncbi:MAG: hypothetical protein KGJ12_03545 [Gammaproteobacteria bacterium]|nr:hypothetical protein [Gammaproteobacteria bacterium]